MRYFVCLLAILAFAAGDKPGTARSQPSPASDGPGKGATKPKSARQRTLAEVGLSSAALDRGVKPCDDFYRFACGGWVKATKIPGDKPRWIRSFSEIHKRSEQALRLILENASRSQEPEVKKLGKFYGACMDRAAAERAGIKPIAPLLKRIAAIKKRGQVAAVLVELHRRKIWAFFDVTADQDFKDATQMIGHLDQNGLGLPDRDFYLKVTPKFQKIREEYQAHIGRIFALAGAKTAAAKRWAGLVYDLEVELARSSKTRTERRDPHGLYNRLDRRGVEKLLPSINWAQYFGVLNQKTLQPINVTAPKYFARVETALKTSPLATLKAYLRWTVLRSAAPTLTKAFVAENFKLHQVLTGQKKRSPRWKRCVAATDGALGELLAQPFVKKYFGGESKAATRMMVLAISQAFRKNLASLSWMDAETKAKALIKLKKMAYLVGYPDKWKRYDFPVGPNHTANLLAASAFALKKQMAKIGKPVDSKEWEMSPPTVNAYYHPLKNHMVFPAGILQPPFFNVKASLAVNMGAMGMVVGHELTHGFDDKGSLFDADGNLKNWWSKTVGERFRKKTQCVERQYAQFEPLPGLKLNGKLTLGENIADLGGVKLAFHAYRALKKELSMPEVVAEGFTGDQQFFLSLAQIWCAKYRPAFARMKVTTDTHSPPPFRVNGSLMNLKEFSDAFSCQPKSPMRSAKMCAVW